MSLQRHATNKDKHTKECQRIAKEKTKEQNSNKVHRDKKKRTKAGITCIKEVDNTQLPHLQLTQV